MRCVITRIHTTRRYDSDIEVRVNRTRARIIKKNNQVREDSTTKVN